MKSFHNFLICALLVTMIFHVALNVLQDMHKPVELKESIYVLPVVDSCKKEGLHI